MSERTQPFIDRQLVADVEYIEAHSPDVLVDLGILMHVLTKRRWHGDYAGWAECPADWLGKSSNMGFRRVRASVKRLVDWGILTAMSTNEVARKWRRSPNYRYDKRTTSREIKAKAEANPRAGGGKPQPKPQLTAKQEAEERMVEEFKRRQ